VTFRATGSFLFGYDSGIISSVISTSYTEFQDYYHHPAANVTGAIVSVFAGGAFCKSLKFEPPLSFHSIPSLISIERDWTWS